MFRQLQILLAERDRSRRRTLVERLREQLEGVWGQVAMFPGSRAALLELIDGLVEQTLHGALLGETARSFGAVLEIGSEEAALSGLIRLLSGLADRLGGLIDPAASAVIAGTEHVISVGESPLRFLIVLSRLPALADDEFHHYWLTQHSQLIRWDRGYRQFHADHGLTATAARALGVGRDDFEGSAWAYYPDVATYLIGMGNPKQLGRILEDEQRFIDHRRASAGFYRTVWQA